MDALDVRILREYLQGRTLSPITSEFRSSVAAIARAVQADEDIVRHRLKRIQDSGFITDWRLYLNPGLWGGGSIHMRFDLTPTAPKGELVERLRLVPGTTHVAIFYDSLVALFEFEDERSLPRQIELVRRLVGGREAFIARNPFPELLISLTARDWDLLRALRKDPRRSYADVAAAAGLSTGTAKTRLARILAGGVAFAWPEVDMRADVGGVPVQLEARYPAEHHAAIDEAIAAHVESYHWHTVHGLPFLPGDPEVLGYHLIVPNLSVAQENLEWASQVPGVLAAGVYVYEDLINFFDEYDQALDRRLARMPTARAKGGRRRPESVTPGTLQN